MRYEKELICTFWKLKKLLIFAREFAGVAQLVEHDLAKVGVASSSLVSRSNKKAASAAFFNLNLLTAKHAKG
jgi:hypothetical protein